MFNTINNIHWFDLDGCLWNCHAMWWIINKNDPGKCILKITQHEGALITSGFYKFDNILITYNGYEGYISKELYSKICQIKEIDKKDIGFSWREFVDTEMIKKQAKNITFNLSYIEHLKNTNDVVNILTARGNINAHDLLLNKLKNELNTFNINIDKSIFVNDKNQQNIIGLSSRRKALFILQSMVGYKINGSVFINEECDNYKLSYFYDDEEKNIDECKQLQYLYSLLLEGTELSLRNKIKEKIKIECPILYVNLVTTNKENIFITNEIKIF